MLKRKYHLLLKQATGNLYIQIFRHLAAGSVAFIADFATLYLLTELLDINYLLANLFGFLIGVGITYVLSIKWIFNVRSVKKRHIEILLFLGINAVGLLLTSGFMWLFTSFLGIFYLYSKLITTVLVFFWNFVAKKVALFSDKKVEQTFTDI